MEIHNRFLQEKLTLTPLIQKDEIAKKIEEIAIELNHFYKDKPLTIVLILKGAICLASDLIRHLDIPFSLEMVSCQSYGKKGTKPGELKGEGFDTLEITSKEVLLIDDIFDTGATLSFAHEKLREKSPTQIKSLVLLSKNVQKKSTYKPDYVLFEIPDEYVVGYGLDYKEYYRGLPSIYSIQPEIST